MSWTCYSCGTKNPNKADACENCGGNVAAPRSFYVHWIFGGAAFFFVTYLIGAFLGGTLVEVKVAPTDAQVLATAKAQGVTAKTMLDLKPEESKAAKSAVVAKAKADTSPIVMNLIYWFLPFILFIVCGAVVGFVSDGKTIIEAGIGSVIGQIGGSLLLSYAFETDIGWITLIIGLVIGCGLAVLGAWLGEAFQDRRERAVV
ncbi:MAG: hypothetical protein GY847_26875 [Proteobacteria bacterium]|nr:hypothetical protein [Pseudomonadota bacterium]